MMSYRCILLIIVLESTFAWRCTPNTDVVARGKILPPEYSDPYLNSFRNKNIHYVVIYNKERPDLHTDSLELDRRGNVIRHWHYGYRERRAYDSADYCIRFWQNTDITGNYLLKYSVKGDTLSQWRREYISSEWMPSTDTTTRIFAPHGTDRFVFDEQGRVKFEFWGYGGEMVKYIYDKDKLIDKELYMFQNGKYELSGFGSWHYVYNEKNELIKIKERWSFRDEIYWMSNGLVDSKLVIDSMDIVRKLDSIPGRYQYGYRYIFY